MIEGWAPGPVRLARLHAAWLKKPIVEFINERIRDGYKPSMLIFQLNCLLRLSEFATGQGIAEKEQLPGLVEPLLADASLHSNNEGRWRSLICWFLTGNRGLARSEQPQTTTLVHESLVDDYIGILREYRGLGEGRRRYVRRHCCALLRHVGCERCQDLSCLTPIAIRAFITSEGQRCSRLSLRSQCSSVRGFLRYLFQRGAIEYDWSPSVASPRVFRDESYPRFMTASEIDATLSVINRETAQGKRDFAILLLLATYGVRGIELCRLQLDDIDWRRSTIVISARKAGNNSSYPLTPTVGNALIDYLREARPQSQSRNVLLSVNPPFHPIRTTQTLIHLVAKYARLAGVKIERPGTHTFRYSVAQRLLENEHSLKSIGDYLGHAHPDSTTRYMKIADGQLREVATGDIEDII